ncbi:MAG: 30S ribosomal protein S4 [Patescibacteria group bacterium]
MMDLKCKKCRRAKEKLFLKGERCYSPKCSVVRKPYAPGIFGKKGSKHTKPGLSEYGVQLMEKQMIRNSYGLKERQFANYVRAASRIKGEDRGVKLYEFLESRLDNVVFRMGFTNSRNEARQLVNHGHLLVNNRKVNIPSYRVKIGDKISIRALSKDKSIFKNLDIKLKKYSPPLWIKLDKEKMAEIVGKPFISNDPKMEKTLHSIIEFYSR